MFFQIVPRIPRAAPNGKRVCLKAGCRSLCSMPPHSEWRASGRTRTHQLTNSHENIPAFHSSPPAAIMIMNRPLALLDPQKCASTTMATDALELQQSKKRRSSVPAYKKCSDGPYHHESLKSHSDSLFTVMFRTLPHSENSSSALPFPTIRWEDDEDDCDCMISDSDHPNDSLKEGGVNANITPPSGILLGNKRKYHCLRRSLACLDHLSAMDQSVASSSSSSPRLVS